MNVLEPMIKTVPAVPDSVTQVRQAVTEFARRAGASGALLEDMRLAVTEAVANVVVHAYIDEAKPGLVRVEATLGDAEIEVVVGDRGRGMMPRVDSPGLGLGLPLIAQCATSVDTRSTGDGGTELRMSFRLDR
jgi:anti-sigma regulatory factor (Ser/Thr protein kinase)